MNEKSNVENIQIKIEAYLKKGKSDFAYLINGEWGSGKTFLLNNRLKGKIISIDVLCGDGYTQKYRPIFISLSGVNSLVVLKELMFSSINIENRSPRTIMDDEIDILTKKEPCFYTFLSIPKNIVYCFDDLERINIDFLEEALGFINLYIEHEGTKVIFSANENKLKELVGDKYLKIKEKYIRYTLELTPNYEALLGEAPKLNQDEKAFIKTIMRRGGCDNLRTLIFILSSWREIEKQVTDEEPYSSKIRNLLIYYITFFSIELKKGVPYEILIKIIGNTRIPTRNEIVLPLDKISDSTNLKAPIPSDDEAITLQKKEINKRYFTNNSEPFERFESIAYFLHSGIWDEVKFQSEISVIYDGIRKREVTDEDKTLKKIKNIYELSDETYINTINEILDSVDKGEYSLRTYLQIYSQLLILESYNIKDIDVNNAITGRFESAMTKASEDNNLKYDSMLKDFYSQLWSSGDTQSNKYREIFNYADNINNKLANVIPPLGNILTLIKNGKITDTYFELVDNGWHYSLNESDAGEIFNSLKEQGGNKTIDLEFILNNRYKFQDGWTAATNDRPFIKKMIDLTDKYEKEIGDDKTPRYIAFVMLNRSLKKLVKLYTLA